MASVTVGAMESYVQDQLRQAEVAMRSHVEDHVREQVRDADADLRNYVVRTIEHELKEKMDPLKKEFDEVKERMGLSQQPLQAHLAAQDLTTQVEKSVAEFEEMRTLFDDRMKLLEKQINAEEWKKKFEELEATMKDVSGKVKTFEEKLPPGLKPTTEAESTGVKGGEDALAPTPEPVGTKAGAETSAPSQVPWPTPTEAAAREAIASDPEMKKHIWERKGFSGRVVKFSNEKGDK